MSNVNENASITLYGKGNKTKIVPISQELVSLINKYLKEIFINYKDAYLFYSNYKKSYSSFGIGYIIKNLIVELKLNYPNYFNGNYHPHSFSYTNLFKIQTFNNNSLFYGNNLLI